LCIIPSAGALIKTDYIYACSSTSTLVETRIYIAALRPLVLFLCPSRTRFLVLV
jgi:hypothetical protein